MFLMLNTNVEIIKYTIQQYFRFKKYSGNLNVLNRT